jgi:hypothetical protein
MPSGPPPTAAPLTVPVDASVQKAKAAKVDTTVAGMQLGEPLRLPNCGIMLEAPSANCNLGNTAEAVQLFGIPIAQDKNADPELWRVRLSDDYSPDWLAGDVFVRIHDGVLVGVYLLTKGRNVERAVNAELRAKYGAPIGFYSGTITPDSGGAPFKYNNPEWMPTGLHVEYEVLMQYPNEDRVNMTNGVVRIETADAYQRRMAKRNAPPKRKL